MTEKEIWDALYKHIQNPCGVAAVMGNLMAESSMNPLCATGKNKVENYATCADLGFIDFANDGVAFGLAQWCYKTRKAGLLSFAQKHGKSVGDAHTQLEYLWQELQGYKTAYNAVMNATNIRTASEVFMLKYENPSNKSEAMKIRRANYGQKYYDKYVGGGQPVAKSKMVVATDNVNVRAGDSKKFPCVDKITKGASFEWVATSPVTGWHAIRQPKRIGWVSNEFTTIKEE